MNRTIEERLTKSEWRIVRCVAVDCLTVRETSEKLCVIYQCIANHLQQTGHQAKPASIDEVVLHGERA